MNVLAPILVIIAGVMLAIAFSPGVGIGGAVVMYVALAIMAQPRLKR